MTTARLDHALTYLTGGHDVALGSIVEVPLGTRTALGFVVGDPTDVEDDGRLRAILSVAPGGARFDRSALSLAEWLAERYLSSLDDAITCMLAPGAIPKAGERLVAREIALDDIEEDLRPLYALVRDDFPDGIASVRLMHAPAARRIADRTTLRSFITRLVRSGALRRTRHFAIPKTRAYTIDVLMPGQNDVRGAKARALQERVREQPGIPMTDAILAGFTRAVIARCIELGSIRIEQRVPALFAREEPKLPDFRLTEEQDAALARLRALLRENALREAYLEGITGSGKTLVYLDIVTDIVRSGGRALVLVPEIGLTPQTARRFEAVFGARVAVLHSALSDIQRADAWHACERGEIDVLVGARSAVFAPMPDLRAIIVDEAHDPSYKQENSPRYHAIAVARERMKRAGGLLLLGSATPSLEHVAAMRSHRIDRILLTARATAMEPPSISIVDLRSDPSKSPLSATLTQGISERLDRKEKTILFVNRRGSAGFVLCRECGTVPECPRCTVSLTLHRGDGLLRCHYCDYRIAFRPVCAACGAQPLREFAVGTQGIVEELSRLFPTARVIRMDGDTTTHIGDHARLLDAFAADGDILVGTQMVAKGLDFPTVTLVGVISADIGLHFPDFRAAERTFALLMQVCGRSGRSQPGEAIVQTYYPEHPLFADLVAHDFQAFADRELSDRDALDFPPAKRLVYLGVIGPAREVVERVANEYADALRTSGRAEVLGPAPYAIPKLNDEWRYRIALKTDQSPRVRAIIREHILPRATRSKTTRLIINIDP
ncbi:MAG: replication restart helicase PriA [Vulcanimicrobiaceae bacterium]